jgi:acyl dehydratase
MPESENLPRETDFMKRPILPNRIPHAPQIGAKASFSRTFTETDVALFIGVTWDVNPLHTDETYTSQTRFKHRIVPGLLTASLLTHLGGLWAFLATEMTFQFQAPVYVGQTILAESEVVELDESRGWVRLSARCTNEQGVEVLRAEILGFPGRFEER